MEKNTLDIDVRHQTDDYWRKIRNHLAQKKTGLGGDLAWLDRKRHLLDSFYLVQSDLERDDYWCYSDLSYTRKFLQSVHFKQESDLLRATLVRYEEKITSLLEKGFSLLVFVNGFWIDFDPRLVGEKDLQRWKIDFNRYDAYETEQDSFRLGEDNLDQSFECLNQATNLVSYELTVHENVEVTEPLCFLFISDLGGLKESDSSDIGYVVSPRIKINLRTGSALKYIEEFFSKEDEVTLLNNHLLEIDLAPNSKLIHLSLQNESRKTCHMSTGKVDLTQQSQYCSYVVQIGGLKSTVSRRAVFRQPKGGAEFYGLYLTDRDQHMDHLIDIVHQVGECESSQLYKGVLWENGCAGFTGKVTVARDAQKTLSNQLNNTLILGEDALMQSRPQLEILADDVKCNHGSTVGQMSEEEIFYLTSRGMTRDRARQLLSNSFVGEFYQELEKKLPEGLALLQGYVKGR